MGTRRIVSIGLLLCLGLPSAQASGKPAVPAGDAAAAEQFCRADEALGRLDLASSCGLWAGLLDHPVYSTAALYRLERWQGHCDLSGEVDRIVGLAGDRAAGPSLHVWRLFSFAASLFDAQGRSEEGSRFKPAKIAPVETRWFRVPAPVLTVFAGQGELAPEATQGSAQPPGVGGAAMSRHCFSVEGNGRRHFRFSFPNPGLTWLDGKPLFTVGPDAGGRFPLVRHLSLDLDGGTHCFRFVQAVTGLAEWPAVEAVPRRGLESSPPPSTDQESAGWHRPAGEPVCEGDRHLCDWVALALESLDDAGIDRLASQALDSTSDFQLYFAYLDSPLYPAQQREDAQLEALTTWLSAADECLASAHLIRLRLSLGEEKQAQRLFRRMSTECLASAPALLLFADLAELKQWGALRDEYLDRAHEKHPTDCLVAQRWYERKLELGVYLPGDSLPVRCAGVIGTEKEYLVRTGKSTRERPSPLTPEVFERLPRGQRLGLMRQLAAGNHDDATLLKSLAAKDPQVSWQLADLALARVEADEARRYARGAYLHENTWAPVRVQAGKLFFWEPLRVHFANLDEVIDSYVDSEFASDMPFVVVLDEMVASPSPNGWISLVVTTVHHLISPDAAESVGEISLSADEELVELAVRKPDGTWLGPEELLEAGMKDTISLRGLSPGDFLIKRTIREVPVAAGTNDCFVMPAFYFGDREYPIYLGRYVATGDLRAMEHLTRGEFDVREETEGAFVVEKNFMEPVPAEAYSPDREAGLDWVQTRSRCHDWPLIRDRAGDSLLALCNTGGVAARDSGRAPADIFRDVVTTISEDGSPLASAAFDSILASGTGNRVLALYCALIQEGHGAHIVAVNAASDQPLDLGRPSLAHFNRMVVYLAGENPQWFDPYDRLAVPGHLRPLLRGRRGIVLTPAYPHMFLTTPDEKGGDLWVIEAGGVLEEDGRLHGEVTVRAGGGARAELDYSLRETTDAARRKVAQVILARLLPTAQVEGQEYVLDDDEAILRLRFEAAVELTPKGGRFLLLLPPFPSRELGQLAQRTSPLFFGGLAPTRLVVSLEVKGERKLGLKDIDETLTTPFGRVALKLTNRGRKMSVVKESFAPPDVVSPGDYGVFLEFLGRSRRLSALTVAVTGEGP